MLESRTSEGSQAIRRRRECLDCAERFTTYERVERQPLYVVKDDGSRQPFDREKLLRGLMRASSKRDIPTERLEALVIDIETQLREMPRRELRSELIGKLALQGLYDIDAVAYVRFASVYHAYDDVQEFQYELDRLHESRCDLATPSTDVHSS